MTDNQPNMPERMQALESALMALRGHLHQVTAELRLNPGNTRLVIRRVNLMKHIMLAQTELDQLSSGRAWE
ncbi:MAG: hypothetical protein ACK4JB_02725 [Reyranella sp.]